MTSKLARAGGAAAVRSSLPALDSRGAPGDDAFPHAVTAIAAAHKLARMASRMTRARDEATKRHEVREAWNGETTTGRGGRGTGNREPGISAACWRQHRRGTARPW